MHQLRKLSNPLRVVSMTTRSAAVIVTMVVASLHAGPTPPAVLTEVDLSVGGMKWVPDTADARRTLGPPSSVKAYVTRIDDEDLHLTDWFYPGLRLIFSQNGKLRWARVTGHGWPTHRGLRVGDSVDRVVALYGAPRNRSDNEYSYQLPGDSVKWRGGYLARPSRLGLFAAFEKGRITVIGVGLIVEGD